MLTLFLPKVSEQNNNENEESRNHSFTIIKHFYQPVHIYFRFFVVTINLIFFRLIFVCIRSILLMFCTRYLLFFPDLSMNLRGIVTPNCSRLTNHYFVSIRMFPFFFSLFLVLHVVSLQFFFLQWNMFNTICELKTGTLFIALFWETNGINVFMVALATISRT